MLKTLFVSGVIFFSYMYFCIYGKKMASAGLSRFWLMLVYPSFWALFVSIMFYLPKHFIVLGYDNIIWGAMTSEATPAALRIIASTLYVLMMTSPVLVPIIICSLMVGMVKRPNGPRAPKFAVS